MIKSYETPSIRTLTSSQVLEIMGPAQGYMQVIDIDLQSPGLREGKMTR
ncbi:MAG: hypothetical protein OEV00_10875 [Acidobacteriota bacterium]|nr:hypothetical protein [Acidobacteriota bacterium]MDH3785816.1 hypothetical protein [Acidobacteriota bacterium]